MEQSAAAAVSSSIFKLVPLFFVLPNATNHVSPGSPPTSTDRHRCSGPNLRRILREVKRQITAHRSGNTSNDVRRVPPVPACDIVTSTPCRPRESCPHPRLAPSPSPQTLAPIGHGGYRTHHAPPGRKVARPAAHLTTPTSSCTPSPSSPAHIR